jgi:hypothetical protein
MFDGFGMLCKVRISKGRVFTSQRFLQSKAFRWGTKDETFEKL